MHNNAIRRRKFLDEGRDWIELNQQVTLTLTLVELHENGAILAVLL